MKVLLDTCILAELQRENASPAVIEHVGSYSVESLFISSITIGEIVKVLSYREQVQRKSD